MSKLDITSLVKKIEVKKEIIQNELEAFFVYMKNAANYLDENQSDLFEVTLDDIQVMLECLELLNDSNKVSTSKRDKINKLHWKLYTFWVKNNKK